MTSRGKARRRPVHPDEYPSPRPRRNGSGVLLLAVVLGAFMIIIGAALNASQAVQAYSCTSYACSVTNVPVTATYEP